MNHLVLLGDSVFDNAPYVAEGLEVSSRLNALLPPGWQIDVLAKDGATTQDIDEQLAAVPPTATHLILSIGGNDALLRSEILTTSVNISAEAFHLLHSVAKGFERNYLHVLNQCKSLGIPMMVCTVYNGAFADEGVQHAVEVGVMAFNDVIVRAASRSQVGILDLRSVCNSPADFTQDIEPSAQGAEKIAKAIVSVVCQERAASARVWG